MNTLYPHVVHLKVSEGRIYDTFHMVNEVEISHQKQHIKQSDASPAANAAAALASTEAQSNR